MAARTGEKAAVSPQPTCGVLVITTGSAQLRDVMRDVVTEGTADTLGFGPDIYAKTGTGDVQGQGEPDSWMVAFDPDENVAIAALVVNGGDGAPGGRPGGQDVLRRVPPLT